MATPATAERISRALEQTGLKHDAREIESGPQWKVGFEMEGGDPVQILMTATDQFAIATAFGGKVDANRYGDLLRINTTLAIAKLAIEEEGYLAVVATLPLEDMDARHIRILFGAILAGVREARRVLDENTAGTA